jgi:hypothetical protein
VLLKLKHYAKIVISSSLAVVFGVSGLVYLPSMTSAMPKSGCKDEIAIWYDRRPECDSRMPEPSKPAAPSISVKDEVEKEKQRLNQRISNPQKSTSKAKSKSKSKNSSNSKPVSSAPKNNSSAPVTKQPSYQTVPVSKQTSKPKTAPKKQASKNVSKNNPAIKPGKKSSYVVGCKTAFPGRDKFALGKENKHVTCLGKLLVIAGFDGHYKQGPSPTFTEVDRLNTQNFQLAQGWTGTYYGGDADGYPGPGTWKALVKIAKEKGYKF